MMGLDKRLIQSLIIGVLFFSLCTVSSFGLMFSNETEIAYEKKNKKEDETPDKKKDRTSDSMQSLVVSGASHFLGSYSDILLFLDGCEVATIQEADFLSMQTNLDRAIAKLESARDMYIYLTGEAERTPYNDEIIQKLMEFNYRKFQKSNRLNPLVYEDVCSFLGVGNVRGAYSYILNRMENLLEELYLVRKMINTRSFPKIGMLWNLNRKYSDLLLFGQYMTMVFNRVLGNF